MADDYRAEILARLGQSELYRTLKTKATERDPELIALVDSMVEDACQRTKLILRHMGEFTLHDSDHLFRVLDIMERLLTKTVIQKLSLPELALLILSAFFHDTGMAPSENEVLTWKKLWDVEPSFADQDEANSFNSFKRFCEARPADLQIVETLSDSGKASLAEISKSYLVTEYIRQTHAERAKQVIAKDWGDKVKFRDCELSVELGRICFSHNEDALSVRSLDKNLLCATDTYACLPLIAIILRLADLLDFDGKRTPSVLYSHLYVRHPISLQEWAKHRSIKAWTINPDLIQYSAKCSHPAIEASIHAFCDLIDRELNVCSNLINELNSYNKNQGREIEVKVPFQVNREKIETKTDIDGKPIYQYRTTQFTLSKRQVVELLMGTKLYGSPEIVLRELIQNSIDACLLRQAQERTWKTTYSPNVSVKYFEDGDDSYIEVEDNGTGMDQYIIDNYYSRVGSSFYKSADFFKLKAESAADFTPTSRFGIGILSNFMVADTISVQTRRVYGPHRSSDPISITIEGQDSIFWIKDGDREIPGTRTRLLLKKDVNPWKRMKESDFIQSVSYMISNPPFAISISKDSTTEIIDETTFKQSKADILKDYSWDDHENVRILDLSIEAHASGMEGSALIAILERDELPVKQIDLNSRDVAIDGETYTLERSIRIAGRYIEEASKSITVNDEGEISIDDSSRRLCNSKSRCSLHGINVPTSLFPESWNTKPNQPVLNWPFPILLLVDISGTRDVDLTSSRTDYVMSEKWISFEEQLAFEVCSAIKKLVAIEYWEALLTIYKSERTSAAFRAGLDRVFNEN